jgi:hypothetical protein
VGALRQFVDVDGITLVPYGRIETAANAVLDATAATGEWLNSGAIQIKALFSRETMVSEFESVITRFLPGDRAILLAGNGRLELAPWCDVQEDRIYDDYAAASVQFPELTRALGSGGGFVPSDPLSLSATLDAEVRFAVERGVLIPEFVYG